MAILKQLWTKEVEEPEVKNSYQYVFELREKLEDTLKLAHFELEKAQQKGKHYYDRKSKVRKFQPGEKREATTVEGAVAVGAGATSIEDAVDCEANVDEAEEEEADFLELDGYVAKESIQDVATGPNLTDEQRTEFTDLAKQFTDLFTEAPGTTDLVQHHIKLTSDE
ncbi:unnamed protein product, partial [Porites lobata]